VDRGRTFAPGGIQLAGFPRIAVMLGEDFHHRLAIPQVLACQAHQTLQGQFGKLRRLASRLSAPGTSGYAVDAAFWICSRFRYLTAPFPFAVANNCSFFASR
jgi:hypothetical protein